MVQCRARSAVLVVRLGLAGRLGARLARRRFRFGHDSDPFVAHHIICSPAPAKHRRGTADRLVNARIAGTYPGGIRSQDRFNDF